MSVKAQQLQYLKAMTTYLKWSFEAAPPFDQQRVNIAEERQWADNEHKELFLVYLFIYLFWLLPFQVNFTEYSLKKHCFKINRMLSLQRELYLLTIRCILPTMSMFLSLQESIVKYNPKHTKNNDRKSGKT